MKRVEDLQESKHYQLFELIPGVYAAICGQRGAGIGNAGMVDLGDRVLVFDTFMTPQAAADLLAMSLELTGRQPDLVINSHYHNDHIWGNQVFLPQALILSSRHTYDLILSEGQEEFEWYDAQSAVRLADLQQQYEGTDDAAAKENLAPWLDYFGGLVEAFPNLKICPPQLTFADRLTIYGGTRRAELITFENGHTASDTILYLPDDDDEQGIVFAADLLFVQTHPFLAEADPLQLMAILKEIEQMPFSAIVPGHGPVGTKEDIRQLITYVQYCLETADLLIKEGRMDEEAVKGLSIPEPYASWKIPHFFNLNISHLIKKHS